MRCRATANPSRFFLHPLFFSRRHICVELSDSETLRRGYTRWRKRVNEWVAGFIVVAANAEPANLFVRRTTFRPRPRSFHLVAMSSSTARALSRTSNEFAIEVPRVFRKLSLSLALFLSLSLIVVVVTMKTFYPRVDVDAIPLSDEFFRKRVSYCCSSRSFICLYVIAKKSSMTLELFSSEKNTIVIYNGGYKLSKFMYYWVNFQNKHCMLPQLWRRNLKLHPKNICYIYNITVVLFKNHKI